MEEDLRGPHRENPPGLTCIPISYELPYRPKYKLSIFLFALTLLSTMLVGTGLSISYRMNAPIADPVAFYRSVFKHPAALAEGIPFVFTILGILIAHEMGHYLACRHYRIHATLPYFIPFPNMIGTMGAFIRIRSPFQNRKALFDVGIAGPLAGFIVAVPALFFSLALSKLNPMRPGFTYYLFGESLLFKLVAQTHHLNFPPGMDINYHPVAMGALVGLFATAINLLPVGQLDGGHIVYSVFGQHHRIVSRVFVFVVVPLLMFFWIWWAIWAVIPLLLGMNHPRTLADEVPLDGPRKKLAWLALLVFALSFSLTPIRIFPL
jgi:membrane-associated protease RseP (regulator of RpoE activity)